MEEGRARKGLEAILTQCLLVNPEDEVLVVCDETSEDYAKLFCQLGESLSANCAIVLVPLSVQESICRNAMYGEKIGLPRTLAVALFEANVVISIVSGALPLKPFRGLLIEASRRRDAKLAHIPGLEKDVIAAVLDTDFPQVQEDAHSVALSLGECETVELRTKRDCVLTIRMDGWSREPIQSTGVIHEGSWGNVPPGETFCCPQLRGIEGQVCIDGSVPRIALNRDEYVILDFEAGRLTRWEASSDRLDRFFLSRRQEAEGTGDNDWNALGELGVGLNRAVRDLTGNSLFDEKAYGTVHIALGENALFGFEIKSNWHADMVAKAPTLLAGVKPILKEGELVIEEQHWQIDAQELSPASLAECKDRHLLHGRVWDAGEFLYRRFSRAGRVSLVKIGNSTTSAALHEMFASWRTSVPQDLESFVALHPEFRGLPTLNLISCLNHFGLLSR